MRTHSRACRLSVTPGNSRRSSATADSSPCCSRTARGDCRECPLPSVGLPAWLGWMLSERFWCRSLLLGQPDLTFPDHAIQPVKLAPDNVLRFPVSQRQQPHDDQRGARYVQVPPFGGNNRLPHLEAMVRHGAYLGCATSTAIRVDDSVAREPCGQFAGRRDGRSSRLARLVTKRSLPHEGMAIPTPTDSDLPLTQKLLEGVHSMPAVHNHEPAPKEASGPRCPACGQIFIRSPLTGSTVRACARTGRRRTCGSDGALLTSPRHPARWKRRKEKTWPILSGS